MKLCEYLESKKISQYDFAAVVKVSQAAIQRYVKGKRIPDEEIMPRILVATEGAVTANDFYNLPIENAKPKRRSK